MYFLPLLCGTDVMSYLCKAEKERFNARVFHLFISMSAIAFLTSQTSFGTDSYCMHIVHTLSSLEGAVCRDDASDVISIAKTH